MRSNRSEDLVQPAHYALPKGVPALQEDPARTRRRFLLVAVGGTVAGALGTKLIQAWATPEPSRSSSGATTPDQVRGLEWAHKLAQGETAALVRNSPIFIHVVEAAPADAVLHIGIAKLVAAVRENPSMKYGEWDQSLVSRLHELLSSYSPLETVFAADLRWLERAVRMERRR